MGCPFARVAVWDTVTCQTSVIIAELQVYSIVDLSFSNNGKLLAIVSNDQYHTISVYDWQKNICLSKFSAAYNKILGLSFVQSDQSICVVGHELIQFWHNVATKVPFFVHADYCEMITKKQTYLSVVEFQSLAVTSTAEGLLISFERNKLKRITQAHNGPVFAVHASRRGDLLATGNIASIVVFIFNSLLFLCYFRWLRWQCSCMEFVLQLLARVQHFSSIKMPY